MFLIWAAGFRILGPRLLVVFLDDRPASINLNPKSMNGIHSDVSGEVWRR